MGILGVHPVDFIQTGTGRHIHLAAQNRLDPRLFRRFVKLHGAVHHPVVGDRHRRLPHVLYPFYQLLHAAGAVQQAVFAVYMKMNKTGHPGTSLCLSAILLRQLHQAAEAVVDPRPGQRRIQQLSQLPQGKLRIV